MPTLHDLHDAFDQLADHAPARLHDPIEAPHRHRLLAAGVAAACTAAVAVAVPLAVSAHHPSASPRTSSSLPAANRTVAPAARFDAALPAPASGESPVLAYGFTTTNTKYTVRPDEITRTYQHATILDGDTQVGDLYLYYAGAFDASTATGGTPVDVDGQPGYFATLTPPEHPATADALAWQYADNGWGVIAMADPATRDRAYEVDLAESTVQAHTAQISPVRVPASSGLHVESLASGLPDGSLVLDDSNGTAWYFGWSPFGLTLSDKPGSTDLSLGGDTWIVFRDTGGNADSLGYVTHGWGMTLTPASGATLAQMKQLAASLEFAPDLTDPSTWFTAADVLP